MTEGMDIGFSVLYKNKSDRSEKKTIIPYSRLNSHMVPEDGSIFCSEPGICTLSSRRFLFVFLCN